MKKALQILFLLLGLSSSGLVGAQTLDPAFARASVYAPGTVYSTLAQVDGKRVVAGIFGRINSTAASSLARFDANGALDQSFSQNVGAATEVFKVRQLANSQYLLVSTFVDITAGGLSRNNLLRLNANGLADASFTVNKGAAYDGSPSYVNDAQVQADGKIIIGGYFDTFDGNTVGSIARLNANGSVDASFNAGVGANDEVYNLVVLPDGKILVCGYFDSFDGHAANGLARLNADGSFDTGFVTPLLADSYVSNVTRQADGKLLVNGNMGLSTSTNRLGLIRLNANGTLDTSFSVPGISGGSVGFYYFDNTVVVQPDGKIIVGGSFVQSSANDSRIIRLNADGSLDTSFQVGSGPNSRPYTVSLQADGTLLVGGAFYLLGTRDDVPLVQLTSTGALDAAFAPTIQQPGSVLAMTQQPDGKTVVGGNFTEINGQRVHRLARLNADGSIDAGFAGSTGTLTSTVNSVGLQADGKIVASTAGTVLRFGSGGAPDNTFATASFSGGAIERLVVQADGKIVVGGYFSVVNNRTTFSLVRLTSSGALDPSFSVNSSSLGELNEVMALLVQPDGKIVVGAALEDFTVHVIRFDASGALDNTFNSSLEVESLSTPYTYVKTLALQADGKLLVGGQFDAFDGISTPSITRLTTTGTLDPAFSPDPSLLTGSVDALALQPNGRILVGGRFTSTAPSAASNLIRLLASGQTDDTFAATAEPSSQVNTILVQPNGAIVLGGLFTTIGNQASIAIARLTAPNVLHVASAQLEARTQAWPVPAHETLHLSLDASAQPQSVQLLDNIGRTVLSQPTTQATLTLPLQQLRTGVYLLRVNYASGPVTRRVVVE